MLHHKVFHRTKTAEAERREDRQKNNRNDPLSSATDGCDDDGRNGARLGVGGSWLEAQGREPTTTNNNKNNFHSGGYGGMPDYSEDVVSRWSLGSCGTSCTSSYPSETSLGKRRPTHYEL